MAVIEELSEACRARDVDRTLRCFVESPDTILLGSGEGERADGVDELRALLNGLLSQFALWWTWDRRDLRASGDVAWAMLEGAYHARGDVGDEFGGAYRLCAVLLRQGTDWRIATFHGSEPGQPPPE